MKPRVHIHHSATESTQVFIDGQKVECEIAEVAHQRSGLAKVTLVMDAVLQVTTDERWCPFILEGKRCAIADDHWHEAKEDGTYEVRM